MKLGRDSKRIFEKKLENPGYTPPACLSYLFGNNKFLEGP
jgi:hypothetical protein